MATGSLNGDAGVPATFFGTSTGAEGTGAPGSQGAAHSDTMGDDAYSTQLTTLYESVQNRPVPMLGVGADDVNLPGQNREGLSGEGPDMVASTGAGSGHVGGPPHPNSPFGRGPQL